MNQTNNQGMQGMSGYNQGGAPGYNQGGAPGYNQGGAPGYNQGGAPGYNQGGAPGYNQGGAPGYNQGGAPGYNQGGAPGYNQGGAPGYNQGGAPGYNQGGAPNGYQNGNGGQQRPRISTVNMANCVTKAGSVEPRITFEASITEGKCQFTSGQTTDANGQPREQLRANFTVPIHGRAEYLRQYGMNCDVNQEGTIFLRVTVWDRNAKFIQTLLSRSASKRIGVVITGKITPDTWTGRDGVQHNGLSVSAYEVWYERDLPQANGNYANNGQGMAGQAPAQAPAHGGWANNGAAPQQGGAPVQNTMPGPAAPAAAPTQTNFTTFSDMDDDGELPF